MLMVFILAILFNWAVYLSGLAIFSYYNNKVGCDPISAKYVKNENQVFSYKIWIEFVIIFKTVV